MLRLTIFILLLSVFLIHSSFAQVVDNEKIIVNLIDEKNFNFEPKEIIINEEKFIVSIYQCQKNYTKGDSIIRVIRNFGYRSPYNLKLFDLFDGEFKNPKENDVVRIPLVVVNHVSLPIAKGLSCEDINSKNGKVLFVIRGKEANVKFEEGKYYFSRGYTRAEYDRFEKEENFQELEYVQMLGFEIVDDKNTLVKENENIDSDVLDKTDTENVLNDLNPTLVNINVPVIDINKDNIATKDSVDKKVLFEDNVKDTVELKDEELLLEDNQNVKSEKLENVLNEEKKIFEKEIEPVEKLSVTEDHENEKIKSNNQDLLNKPNKLNEKVEDLSAQKQFDVEKVNYNESLGKWNVSLYGVFESASDTTQPIIIVSELQPGISLGFELKWGERISNFVKFGFFQHSYNDEIVSLDNSKVNIGHLDFGLRYNYFENSGIYFSIGAQEKFLYRQVEEDLFEVQKDLIPKVAVGIEQKFTSYKRLSAFAKINYEAYFKGMNYKGGSAMGGGVLFNYNYAQGENFSTSAIYKYGVHQTSYVEFGMKELVLDIKWTSDF